MEARYNGLQDLIDCSKMSVHSGYALIQCLLD